MRKPRPGLPLHEDETIVAGLGDVIDALEAIEASSPGIDGALSTLRYIRDSLAKRFEVPADHQTTKGSDQ